MFMEPHSKLSLENRNFLCFQLENFFYFNTDPSERQISLHTKYGFAFRSPKYDLSQSQMFKHTTIGLRANLLQS